ncbi:MAG: hypothetical protein Q4G33_04260 [bacterium]|nr:hypothetical protein [bacterium]
MEQILKNDLRYIKTHEAIHTVFRKMIANKPYKKISVTELTQAAKINRKTFYLHYVSLDDLLAEMYNDINTEIIEKIKHFEIPMDLEEMIYILFEYWSTLPPIERKICKYAAECSVGLTFAQQMRKRNFNYTAGLLAGSSPERNFLFVFIMNTIAALYQEWRDYHTDMSLQDAVNMTFKFICNGISGFEKKSSN